MCNKENLFDTNVRKFDAQNTFFLSLMLRPCKSLGKIFFLKKKLNWCTWG